MNAVTAQIACEAILNHPDDGWATSDLVTVLADARAIGVAPFYTDALHDLLAARMREEGRGQD